VPFKIAVFRPKTPLCLYLFTQKENKKALKKAKFPHSAGKSE